MFSLLFTLISADAGAAWAFNNFGINLMYSLENLKRYCRTCLIDLENLNDVTSPNSISFSEHPNIDNLLRVCLPPPTSCRGTLEPDLNDYMPLLCGMCFKKWQEFGHFYGAVLKNEEKLKSILNKQKACKNEKSVKLIATEATELFVETNVESNQCVIEKYDTLSPFYANDKSNGNHDDLQPFDVCHSIASDGRSDCNDVHEGSNDMDGELSSEQDIENTCFEKNDSKQKIRRTSNNQQDKMATAGKKSRKFNKANYRCLPCKKYFYEIRKYEAHVKQVHEGAKKPYQCKQCDKAYKFHKTLVDHIAAYHSDRPLEPYKCEICNNLFKTHVTLKTHIQNKHPESDAESKRIICDQCGFLAVNQISLRKHIKNRHTASEELKCEECPKVFKNQYYLKYHKLNFHNPSNIKPFQCNECSMAFTRLSLLNTHKRSHIDIAERIKCDFEGCEVRFLQQAEKRRHMRLVHLKVKQYVCDVCGAAFGTKPTLRHHRYIHTNEKPYKCNVCDQGFRQRSAMKTHLKIHIGK